jgi:hypothetical protein
MCLVIHVAPLFFGSIVVVFNYFDSRYLWESVKLLTSSIVQMELVLYRFRLFTIIASLLSDYD